MRLIVLFVVLASVPAAAQNILTDPYIKPGLYAGFLPFRTNTPTLAGVVDFDVRRNGQLTEFVLNNTPLAGGDIRSYWGFSKEQQLYVNVARHWPKLGLSTVPKTPFCAANEVGHYTILIVETSGNGALAGAIAGGLIGGLIGAALDASLDFYEILALNHNTGSMTVVTRESIVFLIADEPALLKKYDQEKKVSRAMLVEYLKEFNAIKRQQDVYGTFDEKEHWAIVTIVRKADKQDKTGIGILRGDIHLADLTDNGQHVRDTVPPMTTHVFGVGDQKTFTVNLKEKERVYYQVSMGDEGAEIKEIDYSRTRYLIDRSKK